MVGDLADLDTHDVDRFEMNLAMGWSDSKKWRLMSTVVRLSEGGCTSGTGYPSADLEGGGSALHVQEPRRKAQCHRASCVHPRHSRAGTNGCSERKDGVGLQPIAARVSGLRQVVSRKHRHDFRPPSQMTVGDKSP